MKKLFLPVLLSACLALIGCNNKLTDIAPEHPTGGNDEPVDPNQNWVDTLRPPLNPFVIENQNFHRATKDDKTNGITIINERIREKREREKKE